MMAGSATAATVLLERHDGPADLLLHVEVLESADPTCSFFVLSHNCNLLSKKNPSARCKNNFEGHVLDSYELRVCSEAHRVTSSKFGKWWLRFDCLFFMIQSFFWQRATEALNQIDLFLEGASTASSEMTSFSKI